MNLAVAILAHQNLHRVARVARFLSDMGVHVAIHVDANIGTDRFVGFKNSLSTYPNILWVNRIACNWGDFSLVEATLEMSNATLKNWPDVGHVLLVSGDSLPIRPISALQEHLKAHTDTDFIESVQVSGDNWVTDGLGSERFTLFFPFQWKTQRWLFDTAVTIQRKLRIKRRAPNGLRLHIGSQWWCLTRRTLTAILKDRDRLQNDAYFKKCWIPDESYFATLARKHARKIESRSLVFSQFDHQGKPLTFYDDHIETLAGLDAFFARKIWGGAEMLYAHFLSTTPAAITPKPLTIQPARATKSPNEWREAYSLSDAPYHVFCGISNVFPDFDEWLGTQTGLTPHGRLFAKDRAYFADHETVGPGGLSDNANIRDVAPHAFLSNLLNSTQSGALSFHFEAEDEQYISTYFPHDGRANTYYIRHSWVLALLQRDITNTEYLHSIAARYLQQEHDLVASLSTHHAAGQHAIWSLGDVLADPADLLACIRGNILDEKSAGPMMLPTMTDASDLIAFGQKLRNMGVDIDVSMLEFSTSVQQSNSRAAITQ